MIRFSLPDGSVVDVHADVARAASWLHYQLADGRIVVAVRLAGE